MQGSGDTGEDHIGNCQPSRAGLGCGRARWTLSIVASGHGVAPGKIARRSARILIAQVSLGKEPRNQTMCSIARTNGNPARPLGRSARRRGPRHCAGLPGAAARVIPPADGGSSKLAATASVSVRDGLLRGCSGTWRRHQFIPVAGPLSSAFAPPRADARSGATLTGGPWTACSTGASCGRSARLSGWPLALSRMLGNARRSAGDFR